MDRLKIRKYHGRILETDYSPEIKTYVADCIERMQAFDDLAGPAMPYLSAWADQDRTVWYEFVSAGILAFLGCSAERAAETFRDRFVERHVYSRFDRLDSFSEEILDGLKVRERKSFLREEAKDKGWVDAVYKMTGRDGDPYWVKDLARIISFPRDGVFISLGNLSIVTKEMEADEQLKKAQAALKESEIKFREQAVRDDLTGLYNTRYLYRALADLFAQGAHEDRPISLIFMDVDNFKQVVDTHGHLNASQTLREVAHTLHALLLDSEFGVAYGGDEFVVVLPNTTKKAAMERAAAMQERIRRAVYLEKAGLNIRIRMSMGVSTFPEDAGDLTELLAGADRAMFAVKRSGKDSVSGRTSAP